MQLLLNISISSHLKKNAKKYCFIFSWKVGEQWFCAIFYKINKTEKTFWDLTTFLQKLYSVPILSFIDRKSFLRLFSYYSILWISNGENLERTCHACHHCHLIKATTTTYTLHYTVPNTKASYYKGQIISEQNCGVLHFPKKQRNYCKDFCPSH